MRTWSLTVLLAVPAGVVAGGRAAAAQNANGNPANNQQAGGNNAANAANAGNLSNAANAANAGNAANAANAGNPGNAANVAPNAAAFGAGNAAPNAAAAPIGNNALTPAPANAAGNLAAPPANAAAGNAVAPPANAAAGLAVPPANAAAAPEAPPAVTGKINPGSPPGALPGPHGYEMRFQFDQNGAPSMHTFVLKWGAADANLQSVDVLVSDTEEVIQTIPVPQDRVKLVWRDVTEKKNQIKEKIVESLDYNFDKFADLRLLRQWPYKVGQKFYLIYIFDEHKNQYVLNEAVSALQGAFPDSKARRIETTELGGYGGGEYVTRGYSINPAGRLKVQTKETQTILDRRRLTFLREIRVRVAGELQRICKIAVLTEGKPKLLWGNPAKCEAFMAKQPPAK